MTGEMLFLRYAFPCVQAKAMRGLISAEHKAMMEECMARGRAPSRRLLKYCFPNAFKGLKETAGVSGVEVWGLANVKAHWRCNHQRDGACGVRLVTVDQIMDDGKLVMSAQERFLNIYALELKISSSVYVHKGCVIEELETAHSSAEDLPASSS